MYDAHASVHDANYVHHTGSESSRCRGSSGVIHALELNNDYNDCNDPRPGSRQAVRRGQCTNGLCVVTVCVQVPHIARKAHAAYSGPSSIPSEGRLMAATRMLAQATAGHAASHCSDGSGGKVYSQPLYSSSSESEYLTM